METTTQRPAGKLYKSRTNRMIDGVCGGIGEYFGIDPTLVRICWVLVTLLGGSGFFLYIAAMIIMPANPELPTVAPGTADSPGPVREPEKKRFWGIILVLVGAFLLLINLGWLSDLPWWSFSHRVVFPLLLIGIGGILVLTYAKRSQAATASPESGAPGSMPLSGSPGSGRELHKSRTDKKLFGVCGGLAEYFGIDSTIVRIVYVVLVLASFGWALLLYIIMGIVMPEDKRSPVLS